MNTPDVSDPWLGAMVLIGVIGLVAGVLVIGGGLVWLSDAIPRWRAQYRMARRRRRRLELMHQPQPYDARFTNSVYARDWRMDERAAKLLREAA